MNNPTEKIDVQELIRTSCDQNVSETVALLQSPIDIFWSWGAHKLTNYNNRVLRMNVQGHLHKGHVYVRVSGSDLFDVFYTTNRGTIKEVSEGLYFNQLQDVMDEKIERQSNYAY